MSPYEDAITKIKAVLGPDMHEGVDAAITVCEDLILHGHKNCAARPVYLTTFYRGLITATGTSDSSTKIITAVASALLLKFYEDKTFDEQALGRHSYALQVASAEINAKTAAEYIAAQNSHPLGALIVKRRGEEDGIAGIIAGLFKQESKPGEN